MAISRKKGQREQLEKTAANMSPKALKGRPNALAARIPIETAPVSTNAFIRHSNGCLLVEIKVIPGAAKSEFGGIRDGVLLARIAAPPEKGKANEELRKLIASSLSLPRSEILLVAGASSRRKRFSIPLSAESALRDLARDNE